MRMLFLTVACWLVTIGFFMAVMAKMTKLSLLRQILEQKLAMKLPGLWAFEYILLFLVIPAGFSFCLSIRLTAGLAGLLPN